MCSSQVRADQMPDFPREGQLMCALFLSMCACASKPINTNDVRCTVHTMQSMEADSQTPWTMKRGTGGQMPRLQPDG